jgi:hypothetical protein
MFFAFIFIIGFQIRYMAAPITELMAVLPQLFQYLQIIAYVVLLLFFGSVAMRGWKGYLPIYFRWPARIGVGFICLIAGIALGPLITGLGTGILKMFQLDVVTVGVISAIIVSVGLYLISYRSHGAVESMKREIERLERKVSDMKGKVRPGWTVAKIMGLVIIIALVAVSAASFRGFPPAMSSELFESFGIPEEISRMSPECMGLMTTMATLSQQQDAFQNPPVHQDDALKALIEQGSGKSVSEMYRIEESGQTIILGVMGDNSQCIASETEFCMCP